MDIKDLLPDQPSLHNYRKRSTYPLDGRQLPEIMAALRKNDFETGMFERGISIERDDGLVGMISSGRILGENTGLTTYLITFEGGSSLPNDQTERLRELVNILKPFYSS